MIAALMLGLWVLLTWYPSLWLAGMGRVSGRAAGSITTLTFGLGLGALRGRRFPGFRGRAARRHVARWPALGHLPGHPGAYQTGCLSRPGTILLRHRGEAVRCQQGTCTSAPAGWPYVSFPRGTGLGG
jgi:hypothetical protein